MRALPRSTLIAAALLAGALAAWIVTLQRMQGMDAGPGTDLGGLGWYLGIWVTMMAAMMLPSAAPMVLLFARVSREKRKRGQAFVPTWVFAAGYLAAWTGYGLVAYGIYRGIRSVESGAFAWDSAGPYVAGAALVAAGIYELTPLKTVCLRHCRTPMHFLLGGWRTGWFGSFRMGVEHGGYCVGCCWGLMLALFALGVMSLFWMGVVAAVILIQKLVPLPQQRLTTGVAAALIGLGVWIAASPGSVPGLVQPNSKGAADARMRMMHVQPSTQMERPGSMPMQKPKPSMSP